MSTTDSSKRRRFAIALSFPGERREYVEQVANALLPAFGGEKGKARIFYDGWHEGSIISRIMKYAPSNLIGREAETKVLNDAWDQVVRGETKRPHILTFVALGGEGKTSVVAKWSVDLAFQDWPGCEAVLAWSFYSQVCSTS